MSIFGTILSKLFPSSHPANAQTSADQAPSASGAAATSTSPPATLPPVDVEAILDDLASKNPQKLNWKTSIVDLMKLLSLDSSLASRKQLAGELHYSGDTNDSAAMNIWLHKQVMNKLAENGGRVPDSLKD